MLKSISQLSEELDAITMRKRLAGTPWDGDQEMQDEIERARSVERLAMLNVRPLAPWTTQFQQGSFITVPSRYPITNRTIPVTQIMNNLKTSVSQLQNMKQDIRSAATVEQKNALYLGRGNVREDIKYAGRSTQMLLNKRTAEATLLNTFGSDKINRAIVDIQKKKNDQTNLKNMSTFERMQYMDENHSVSATDIYNKAASP